mmetsp:Transcript_70739/g.160016  ORF Transcript_70739/g.160016 Transcript_70739/m.160016 type:complete len:243 (-) Transcript_70739:364-1092(-)
MFRNGFGGFLGGKEREKRVKKGVSHTRPHALEGAPRRAFPWPPWRDLTPKPKPSKVRCLSRDLTWRTSRCRRNCTHCSKHTSTPRWARSSAKRPQVCFSEWAMRRLYSSRDGLSSMPVKARSSEILPFHGNRVTSTFSRPSYSCSTTCRSPLVRALRGSGPVATTMSTKLFKKPRTWSLRKVTAFAAQPRTGKAQTGERPPKPNKELSIGACGFTCETMKWFTLKSSDSWAMGKSLSMDPSW